MYLRKNEEGNFQYSANTETATKIKNVVLHTIDSVG